MVQIVGRAMRPLGSYVGVNGDNSFSIEGPVRALDAAGKLLGVFPDRTEAEEAIYAAAGYSHRMPAPMVQTSSGPRPVAAPALPLSPPTDHDREARLAENGAVAADLAAAAAAANERVTALTRRSLHGERVLAELEVAIAERDEVRAQLNALPTGRSVPANGPAVQEARRKLEGRNPMMAAVQRINARNTRTGVVPAPEPEARVMADAHSTSPVMQAVLAINQRRAAAAGSEASGAGGNPLMGAIAHINAETAARYPGAKLAGGTRPTPLEATSDE
jgi:hypothetical protein